MSELVTDYLERELPLRQRLAMRIHLFQCTACTNYFDQMRRTVQLLRQAPSPPPAAEVEDRLLRRAQEQSREEGGS
ncbi:MAG: anti-sigma factor [Acetobacteraceae bacterium]